MVVGPRRHAHAGRRPGGTAARVPAPAPPVRLIALAVVGAGPHAPRRRVAQEPGTTTTSLPQVPTQEIVPQPNAGAAPDEAGDRGGALQLACSALVVVAIGGVVVVVVRQSRRARQAPDGWPLALVEEGVAGRQAGQEPVSVGAEALEGGADGDVAGLHVLAGVAVEEERDHGFVEVAGGQEQRLALVLLGRRGSRSSAYTPARQSAWRLVATVLSLDPEARPGRRRRTAGRSRWPPRSHRSRSAPGPGSRRRCRWCRRRRSRRTRSRGRRRRRCRLRSAPRRTPGSIGTRSATGVQSRPSASEHGRPEVSRGPRRSVGTSSDEREVAAPLEVVLAGEGHLDHHQVAGRRRRRGSRRSARRPARSRRRRSRCDRTRCRGRRGGRPRCRRRRAARGSRRPPCRGRRALSSKNSELPSSTSRVQAPAKQSAWSSSSTVAFAGRSRTGLDGVAELVGEHDADGEAAELVVELGDQVHVVPRDEVVARAVEGVLGDVGVGGCRLAARRLLGVGAVGPEARRRSAGSGVP